MSILETIREMCHFFVNKMFQLKSYRFVEFEDSYEEDYEYNCESNLCNTLRNFMGVLTHCKIN
jgi:hypothetical protein